MDKNYEILQIDPYLLPYRSDIELRMRNYHAAKSRLLGGNGSLSDFANGHHYFGFHKLEDGWVYREWAPDVQGLALMGDFNQWDRESHKLTQITPGVWEIKMPGDPPHGSRVKVEITAGWQKLDRIPLYSKRVIQDPHTHGFDGQIWHPETPFAWSDTDFAPDPSTPLLIYECHIGMSGIKEDVTSFPEFTANTLPRIKALGYTAIQLMAIAEHPYYGSFGYQVTNFFAVSSRFGTPEELKALIDAAHSMGIAVLLDVVHSHAAKNYAEGIASFNGTTYQFFHSGGKGEHPAWGTLLFDYGKGEVIHFLLSNLKFWLEEYHFDGFRFDGVTSMLYHDHGLGAAFDHYQKYFSMNTDTQAITYLQLAAEVAKEVKPSCILIAEDMSGMPGMCLPIADGGIGFDYRLGMGLPDLWIKLLRGKRDEDWDLGWLWYELNQRRPQEKVVGYCESHDQSLVGDKTIMFWLADKEMYWQMEKSSSSHEIDRAMALHKMIRLLTCTCAGEGYLNFMGNEFGHPEWIDFPREGNHWSYFYARRRWDLADDPNLRYQYLQRFDQSMIALVKDEALLACPSALLLHHEESRILAYRKGEHLFLFNFHPWESFAAPIPMKKRTSLQLVLHSDWQEFGGYLDREAPGLPAAAFPSKATLELPIGSRCAAVYRMR